MAVEETFNSGIEIVAQEMSAQLTERLKEKLLEAGKDASGTLINSIRGDVRFDGSKAVIEVFAEDYFRFVDKGRAPGRFPPISAIEQWVAIKGISKDAVFPIARSIAMEGIKPLNILNPTLDEVVDTFRPRYEEEIAKIVGAVLVNDVFSSTNTKGQIIPKSLSV